MTEFEPGLARLRSVGAGLDGMDVTSHHQAGETRGRLAPRIDFGDNLAVARMVAMSHKAFTSSRRWLM